MKYLASEKPEIIRLVEQAHLPVRRTLGEVGNSAREILTAAVLSPGRPADKKQRKIRHHQAYVRLEPHP